MKGFSIFLILGVLVAIFYYTPIHHRAGTGTYYLNDYISFTTPGGMVGWLPGQEVREVVRAPFVEGSRTVSDGAYTAVIPETVLTQDMEDAEDARLADGASQGRFQSNIAAAKAHYDSVQHTAMIAAAQDITRVNAQQIIASTVGNFATRLNEPAYGTGHRYYSVYYGYPVHDHAASTVYPNRTVSTPPPVTVLDTRGLNVVDQNSLHTPSPTPYPSGVAR